MSNLKYTLCIVFALLLFFQNLGQVQCHNKPPAAGTDDDSQGQVSSIPALADGFIRWASSICPLSNALFPKCVNKYSPSSTITVDKNPSAGQFTSIQSAIDSISLVNSARIVINVNPGVYNEQVYISPLKSYVTIQGSGADNTVIQWQGGSSSMNLGNWGISYSATMVIQASYFIAKNITVKNTTPCSENRKYGSDAVAIKVSGDAAFFLGCKLLGGYNTLNDHLGRHYYKDCFIQGSLDFIHGSALSLYDSCHLHGLPEINGGLGLNSIAGLMSSIGSSFVGCKITGAAPLYLGMSLSSFAKAIFSRCIFQQMLAPKGWNDTFLKNIPVVFGTHNCLGGSGTSTGSSGESAGGSAAGGSGGASAGGSVVGGSTGGSGGASAGGSVVGGSTGGSGGASAGGSVAGGSTGGSGGASAGGSVAGGSTGGSGGASAGGSSAGGSTGASAGGSVAGGSGGASAVGGSTGGGTAGASGKGSVVGGSSEGSAAGGSAGGSVGASGGAIGGGSGGASAVGGSTGASGGGTAGASAGASGGGSVGASGGGSVVGGSAAGGSAEGSGGAIGRGSSGGFSGGSGGGFGGGFGGGSGGGFGGGIGGGSGGGFGGGIGGIFGGGLGGIFGGGSAGGKGGTDIGSSVAASTGMPLCKSIELSPDQAKPFTLLSFINGDDWIKS